MQDLPMLKINVKASSEYNVLIGNGLLEHTGEIISPVISKCKIAVITDDIVDGLYSKTIIDSLTTAGYIPLKYVFKNGEESKNITTYSQIQNFLFHPQKAPTVPFLYKMEN